MPSLRALLLTLFLVILAVLAVILFAGKSKPAKDAQSYAEQNPNCNEIKIHSEKNDLIECFLNYGSNSDFPENPQDTDTLYIPVARFIGERFPYEFPLRIRHIFSFPTKTDDSIEISGNSINIVKDRNSVWYDKKSGCIFPGPCPVMPLKGSAIPQKYAKEDYNPERIFRNKFSAIGEAPVNAILPGRILKIEQEPLFSVKIYHGENIYSKTSGLKSLSNYTQVGNLVSPDSILGFLPTQDTAFLFVEITRNGKYESWEKFWLATR
ncbi:MAG: hypothetical protein LBB36_04170 [Fibromonadaceae bacterium]|jgi:hypothetical protein|nr:hypothetical protein [Fibromonadaceae bacterium]